MTKKIVLTILMCLICSVSFADEYYLGKWVWFEDKVMPHWQAPYSEYKTGNIDLRSLPQSGKKGGTPEGYAIFSYSQKINDSKLDYLGSDVDAVVSKTIKDTLKNKLGISSNFTKTTFKDILWEILTTKADPTGQTRAKPLMPNHKGKIKLNLAKETIKEIALVPFVSPEWENVLAVVHLDYKKMLLTETHEKVAKVLDAWEDKYGVSYETFIPEDATIKLASLPHETTYTDDFNCADNWTRDCDLDWTATHDTCRIKDNQGATDRTGRTTRCRAEEDTSSDDMYALYDGITLTNASSFCQGGVQIRMEASGNFDGMLLHIVNNSAGDTVQIYKQVNDSFTSLASATTPTVPTTEEKWYFEGDGSDFSGEQEDIEIVSVTDTSITGNTRGGDRSYRQNSTNVVYDNFEVGDLGGAPSRRRISID